MNVRLIIVLLISLSFFCPLSAFANNLIISNVSLESRDSQSHSIAVEFDISWENSWKTKINHDAVWLTFRLSNPASLPTDKKLCQVTVSGVNPTGTSVGGSLNYEISVPSDKNGAIIRPKTYGATASVSLTNARVTVNYGTCGFGDTDNVTVDVFALEMVLVPQGSFFAGDYGTSIASLTQGSSDADSWFIQNENAISVTNAASDGFRYVSGGNSGESSTGALFTIPASYPKGYNAFYVMKYELNEGQWVGFVNSLPLAAARINRDLTDSSHKNSDTVQYRNTISCSGSLLVCTTGKPDRAVGYLTWMDLAAFLDWSALRPMSELEYEKTARGSILPVAGEFAWGTTTITDATTISSGVENGSETISNSNANVNFNNTTLSGGDAGNGVDYEKGPIRNGIFATSSSSRENSGAGYYGAYELSGNLKERTITIGNSIGLSFTGLHGDGLLLSSTGNEGNADVAGWPGADAIGSGLKGGAWDDTSSAKLKISDRSEAAFSTAVSYPGYGGRGVRTYEQ